MKIRIQFLFRTVGRGKIYTRQKMFKFKRREAAAGKPTRAYPTTSAITFYLFASQLAESHLLYLLFLFFFCYVCALFGARVYSLNLMERTNEHNMMDVRFLN